MKLAVSYLLALVSSMLMVELGNTYSPGIPLPPNKTRKCPSNYKESPNGLQRLKHIKSIMGEKGQRSSIETKDKDDSDDEEEIRAQMVHRLNKCVKQCDKNKECDVIIYGWVPVGTESVPFGCINSKPCKKRAKHSFPSRILAISRLWYVEYVDTLPFLRENLAVQCTR